MLNLFAQATLTKEENQQEEQNTFSKNVVPSAEKKKIRPVESIQLDSLRILHVDDDAPFLKISKRILELENKFEIDTATSVDEAFSKLKRLPYDAIVCDYEMPLKNGLDFLKELKEQKNNIAFIIFTGRGREVAIKASNLGADHYINKSGSPETVYRELADAIRRIVRRKRASAQKEIKDAQNYQPVRVAMMRQQQDESSKYPNR